VLRAIVPPLVATYAVFVAMVILAWRRPAPRPGRLEKPPEPTPESTGSVLATASGGYVMFLVIVLVFHVWLAGESTRSSALCGVDPSSRSLRWAHPPSSGSSFPCCAAGKSAADGKTAPKRGRVKSGPREGRSSCR
jgi:hypothetical protein